MIINFLKLFLFLFLVLLYSCSSNLKKTTEKKTTIALEVIYNAAYKNFSEGKYEEALKFFELVERDYPYSDWAKKSLLIRSYIYYDANDYVNALTNLQRFKKRHPGNNNLDYVEYMIGICLFEQINYAALSQKNTNLALNQFKKLINLYPKSKYSIDAKFKIDLINEQFAAKEMYIARYYFNRQKWGPAIYRLNNIIENYQTTIFTEEALHRLVEIYYKVGSLEMAKKYASILGYNYNSSDWYKKTYEIVKKNNVLLENNKQKKNLKEKFEQLIKFYN